MKTFNQFQEATEQDLKRMGATPAQIKALKDRAKRRGGSGIGVKGSSGSHFHQGKPQSRRAAAPGSPKSGALARTNPNAIKRQGAVSRVAVPLETIAAFETFNNSYVWFFTTIIFVL